MIKCNMCGVVINEQCAIYLEGLENGYCKKCFKREGVNND